MGQDETPSGEFQTRIERVLDERERVKWHTAEDQVEAFVTIITRRYGIDEEDIPKLLAGLRWASEHKENLEKLGTGAMMTLVGAIISGLLFALWEGAKALLRKTGV